MADTPQKCTPKEKINTSDDEITPDTAPTNQYKKKIIKVDIDLNQDYPEIELNERSPNNFEIIKEEISQKYGDKNRDKVKKFQLYEPNQVYQSPQQEQVYHTFQPSPNRQIIQNYPIKHNKPLQNIKIVKLGQPFEVYKKVDKIYHYNQDISQYLGTNQNEEKKRDNDQNPDYYELNQFHQLISLKKKSKTSNVSKISKNSGLEDKIKKRKNSKPKDSLSKVYITTKSDLNHTCIAYKEKKGVGLFNKIPKIVSFTDIYSKKLPKSKINIDKQKFLGFIEIPRIEFINHAENETLFTERGMNTGKYTFTGKETIIKERCDTQNKKANLSKQEIEAELNRRNKKKKKMKYEVCDKFYSSVEYDKQALRKLEIKKYEKEIELRKLKQKTSELNEKIKYDIPSSQSQIQLKMKNGLSINSYKNLKNINYGNSEIYKNESSMFPNDNFSKYILEQINKIRIDPQSFIKVIEEAKTNIVKTKNCGYIYKGKIKVALSNGESAFNKAISILKKTESMQKLTFSPQLTVEVPKNEKEIKNKNDLKDKIEKMVDKGIKIKSYWKNYIKDPETCFLLMIVDDNRINNGMKRKDILNPNMKYIGISSVEINRHFICYLTLSNCVYN